MIKKIGERLAEGMGVIGGIHGLFETFEKIGKVHDGLPPIIKEKLPGFLGLSLADEQIFNGVLGQLDVKKQVIISNFLYEKCKDYERNRFINIVAGMGVTPGCPEEKETKWGKNGEKVFEKVKAGSEGMDQRKNFLNKFAEVIITDFDNDLQEAYEFCTGGRMILPDPLHQKVLKAFSESLKWAKSINWISCSNQALERATAELRKTDICKKHEGFWSAAFPNKKWATAFWILTATATIAFVGGFIFA